jgi:hypothetical protein
LFLAFAQEVSGTFVDLSGVKFFGPKSNYRSGPLLPPHSALVDTDPFIFVVDLQRDTVCMIQTLINCITLTHTFLILDMLVLYVREDKILFT